MIDEYAFEDLIQVVRLAWDELVLPREPAGLWVEGQHAVCVEGVAIRAAGQPSPRLGLRGRPVHQAGRRVVAARNPGVAAGPERRRKVTPAIATRFSWLGDR